MKEKNQGKNHEKNYGIEWLRILSMYMVAVLHTLGQGGILGSFQQGTFDYSVAWFLETAAYGAVDCFALISGYVGWNSHFRYRKGLRLWLQTVFYTIGITILFAIFMPEAVTKDQWLAACFPIMKKQYWYMTAYAGLFILIPILNRAITYLSGKELFRICLAIFLVFSLLPTLFNEAVFGLGGGYSALWLILLYILGGFWGKYQVVCVNRLPHFLRRHRIFLHVFLPTFGYLLCTIASWALKHFGHPQYVSYTSPTILLGALALFFLFSSLSCGRRSRQLAAFLAPSALSVYLIHVNPLIWDHIMLFFAVGHFPSGLWLSLWVPGVALGIYLLCTIIDLPRRGLQFIIKRFLLGGRSAARPRD